MLLSEPELLGGWHMNTAIGLTQGLALNLYIITIVLDELTNHI